MPIYRYYTGDHAKSNNARIRSVLRSMENIVTFASGGCVYGGFVCEVVIPTLKGDVINELPEDVDIYG